MLPSEYRSGPRVEKEILTSSTLPAKADVKMLESIKIARRSRIAVELECLVYHIFDFTVCAIILFSAGRIALMV
jgi:hypothetical protein